MAIEFSEFLQTGEDSATYINTSTTGSYASPVWTELDLVENVSLNQDHDKKEVKPRRSTRLGYKANLIGLKDFSGSLTCYVPAVGSEDASVAAYNALNTAADKGLPVDLLFVNGAAISTTKQARAIRAVCGVGMSREESGDDPTQETYNFHAVPNSAQNAPVRGTVTGGAFTPAS